MQKDQWINEVLESTARMQKAEPGPFLFEKVTARIERQKQFGLSEIGHVYFNWKFVMPALCLLVINVMAIRFYMTSIASQKNTEGQTEMATETTYDYSTSYSY